MRSKACAARIVAVAMANTPAQTSMSQPARSSGIRILEGISSDEEAAYQYGKKAGGDEGEAPLDEFSDRLAEVTEKLRLQEEPRAARDDGQHYEHEKVVAGKARGDGHDLVGDRGHALDQDDPRAPSGVGRAEGFHAVAIAIDRDQPMPDRVVEECPDGIAENAAEHRCDGANERVEPRLVRLREGHGHEHHVGRNGEKRAFGKGNGGK